jgi:Rrf2 family protein
LQLKGAGIVTSTRGSAGGYHLARDPADLSLGEVMAIIEGQARGPATSMSNKTVASRTLARVWREVAASERQLLEATSFADLAAQVRGHADQMYYI